MTNAIDVSTLSFEQALKELEGIVARLEQGSVPLEESISIYERGDALRKHAALFDDARLGRAVDVGG